MNKHLATDGTPGLVSIVAPAFNEQEGLAEFVRRIDAVMERARLNHEIVFVNDGSSDETLAAMQALQAGSERITVVNLSRNFGKEIAMTAGLAHAAGDVVVIIDTDLQDPPELIPDMVAEWRNGYDVVYAQREVREGETWLKTATAGLFYSMVKRMGQTPIPENVGDFRLMSRRAVAALLQLPETHRFMKGLYAWVGFPQKAIHYTRHARYAGATKFNYWKLWNFAIEGITSFTIVPLKLATYIGTLVASLAFCYGLFIALRTLIVGDEVQGFTTIMVTMLGIGGVQLIVLGVIGEYLGRVFNETKRRPLYLVASVRWSDVGKQAIRVTGLREPAEVFKDQECDSTRDASLSLLPSARSIPS
jgi:glycosyltransferase involved in cell wall biosynthesis